MALSLYKIILGNQAWYYTSGEFDLVGGVNPYYAKPIKRSDLTFDIKQTEVTLTIPGDLEPFHLLKYSAPLIPFKVQIIKYPSLVTHYIGNVVKALFDGNTNVAKITLGSTTTLENSTCPTRTFGSPCSYELFGEGCGLDSSVYQTNIDIGSITVSGTTLTASAIGAHGDGYYAGGYVEASTGETQYIMSQVGNTVTLMGGLATIIDVSSIIFYPGCDKSVTACETKFDNVAAINYYGGFPHIPGINPVTEGF